MLESLTEKKLATIFAKLDEKGK